MRITQEADYALRIVRILAGEDKVLDARSISEAAGVSERFTVKILRKLVLGQIVGSKKGASGGYELAADPDRLTLRQVVETINGPLAISRCLEDSYECSKNGGEKSCCVFHMIFDKLNHTLCDKLDAVSIADIVDESATVESILLKLD